MERGKQEKKNKTSKLATQSVDEEDKTKDNLTFKKWRKKPLQNSFTER